MKKPRQVIGINLAVDKRTLNKTYRLIKMVLRTKNDQATKQEALRVLPQLCSTTHANVNNNNIDLGKTR